MVERETDFDVVLKQLLAEKQKESLPLSPEELAAWRGGDLNEQERAALQKRLVMDPEALNQLLAAEPSNSDQDEAALAWVDFQEKLKKEAGELPEESDLPFPSQERDAGVSVSLPAIAAAVLLAATLWLSWLYLRLGDERAALLAPSLSGGEVQTVYLGDVSPTRDGMEPPTLSSARQTYGLELPFAWQSPRWLVSIADPGGTPIFAEEIETDGGRVITLTLTRDFFSTSGIYRVDVSGLRNGRFDVYGGFDIRVNLD